MIALVGCLVFQAVLASVLPSPWWVPDLASIGLVLAIAAVPHRWLAYAGVAAAAMLAWTIRWAPPSLALVFLAAWSVRTAARRWDAADPRVQVALIIGVSSVLTLAALWSESLMRVATLWGWAGLRLILTVLTACAVARIVRSA